MKKTLKRFSKYRVQWGPLASTDEDGRNGAFLIPGFVFNRHDGIDAAVIVSDGSDWHKPTMGELVWEHVSMSWTDRTPTWAEMAKLKEMFFDEGECVIQYHPPKARYVNVHNHCLHLWKPVGVDMPMPPIEAV